MPSLYRVSRKPLCFQIHRRKISLRFSTDSGDCALRFYGRITLMSSSEGISSSPDIVIFCYTNSPRNPHNRYFIFGDLQFIQAPVLICLVRPFLISDQPFGCDRPPLNFALISVAGHVLTSLSIQIRHSNVIWISNFVQFRKVYPSNRTFFSMTTSVFAASSRAHITTHK